jgi:hypothetical protein
MQIYVSSFYENWGSSYGLSETDAEMSADPDGDGAKNLAEYGLGGNPTNATDSGTAYTNLLQPILLPDGIKFVYPKWKDSNERGLTYYLEGCDDLIANSWSNTGYSVIGTNSLDADFEAITNRIETTMSNRYYHLKIEKQ